VQQLGNLPVDYGAWVYTGQSGTAAVISGSPADQAGIKSGDIILEIAGTKVTEDTSVQRILLSHQAGEVITVKIMRENKEQELSVTLGKHS
jgi:S1-C subfamily serine protease